jgi:hypothetical protein
MYQKVLIFDGFHDLGFFLFLCLYDYRCVYRERWIYLDHHVDEDVGSETSMTSDGDVVAVNESLILTVQMRAMLKQIQAISFGHPICYVRRDHEERMYRILSVVGDLERSLDP